MTVAPVVDHRRVLELLAGGSCLSAQQHELGPHKLRAHRFRTGEPVSLAIVFCMLTEGLIVEARGGNYVITEKGQELLDEDGKSVTLE